MIDGARLASLELSENLAAWYIEGSLGFGLRHDGTVVVRILAPGKKLLGNAGNLRKRWNARRAAR